MIRRLARSLHICKASTNGIRIPLASRFTGKGQVDRETGTVVVKEAKYSNILTIGDGRAPT